MCKKKRKKNNQQLQHLKKECIANGGTWNGAACTYPPTPEEECITNGGTWDGTTCTYPSNPGGGTGGDSGQGGSGNGGNTGTQTQNIAAILSWDPRKLIQQLLNLF